MHRYHNRGKVVVLLRETTTSRLDSWCCGADRRQAAPKWKYLRGPDRFETWAGFETLMAVTMKVTVWYYITPPGGSADVPRCSGRTTSTRSVLHSWPFGAGIIFFLILGHPVYKMWMIQEPNKLELRNKLHFEEKKTESIQPFGAGIIFFLILGHLCIKCE